MATKNDAGARAPRGTKNVTQAFLQALDSIPGVQQKAVATAALAGIRDELKTRRLKIKDAAAKAKAKAPARTKASAKPAAKAPVKAKAKAPAARAPKAAAAGKRTAAADKKPVAVTAKAAKKAPAKAAKQKQVRKPVAPAAPEPATE